MIVGIDLGTTHSLIGIHGDDGPRLIPNALGKLLTPSAVSVDETGMLLIGEAALDRLITHPERSTASFKRWMGSKRETILGKRAYLPEELSALVIRSLLDDAEAVIGERPDEAIISVPAYFSDAQRRATKRAGELAGLKIERLINEPTAAALAYGLAEKLDDALVLVLDLGGGTFDVSILELFDGVVKVHASAGDNYLGGDDFTEAIEAHWLAHHQLRRDALKPSEKSQLKQRAEATKRALGNGQSIEHCLQVGGKEYLLTLNESDFDGIIAPLVQRMRSPIERAMRDAGLRGSDLAEIVMVGGASRMPQLSRLAARLLGRLPLRHVAPDEAIAHGACMAAGLKARHKSLEEIVLTDVCPHSMGIAVSIDLGGGSRSHGHFDPIIERNSTVPVSRIRDYYPIHENQTSIILKIYQGENPWAENNIALGSLDVPIPPGAVQDQGVDVRFTYDINGVLQVEATVKKSGVMHELLCMRSDSDVSEDEARRRFSELAELKTHPRDELSNVAILARAERMYMESLGEERGTIQSLIADFQSTLATQDRALIQDKRDAFSSSLDRIEAE